MYGKIKTQWRFEGNDFFMNVSIPANTSATVYVLSRKDGNVTEDGKSISKNGDISYLKSEGNYSVYEVKSGNYQFASKASKNLLKNIILPNPVIYPGNTLASVHDSVRINITSDVADALIHYTTDGSVPDSTSQVFKSPFYVLTPMTIHAKAYLNGYRSSFVKTTVIEFADPEINGLRYNIMMEVGRNFPILPDFRL